MITNQEIVDTYLAYRHLKLTDPKLRDDVHLLMPFYLMDASYQVYCKDIKDYPCKHKIKEAKSRWKESYRQFNAAFFLAFNDDQIEFITDQMDEFEEFIHNKVVMLKSTVMDTFSASASFEEKKILAAVLTSNALSLMAQHVYSDMYRDSHLKKQKNHLIEAVTKYSYEFARHFPVSQGVDLTSSERVSLMIDSLCKEVIKFLKSKFYGREN